MRHITNHVKSIFCICGSFFLMSQEAHAILPSEIRWHNEATDTTKITTILISASELGTKDPNQVVAFIGKQFIGTPYVAGTLEGTPEMLTVNVDELDCTTYIDVVSAMALTIGERRNSWQDFLHNLEKMRYRQGRVDGYASRIHYISDWIVTNTHKGLIRDVTDRLPQPSYHVKTLDYMSRHRDSYPALKDSLEYERIKSMEVGYRSHRYPYIKSGSLLGKNAAKLLKEGDIVALTTKTDGLDVSHMGIIIMENDGPHLMHASMKEGKVVIDRLPIGEYLRKNRSITGLRVIRLQEQ